MVVSCWIVAFLRCACNTHSETLTLTLPGPSAGVSGILTVTVA